jgi:hypothetical protein
MKGGVLGIPFTPKFSTPEALQTIDPTVFKNTGYAHAENAFKNQTKYPVKAPIGYPANIAIATKLKTDYAEFYRSLGVEEKKISNCQLNLITKSGTICNPLQKRVMVTPEKFNEIIDYIAENKIAKKNMSSWNPTAKVTKTRNQEYIDFGESLNKLTPSNTGATAAAGALGNITGFAGSAMDNIGSNMKSNMKSRFGSLFGNKSS